MALGLSFLEVKPLAEKAVASSPTNTQPAFDAGVVIQLCTSATNAEELKKLYTPAAFTVTDDEVVAAKSPPGVEVKRSTIQISFEENEI